MSKKARFRKRARFVSKNSDNRHFCIAIQRQKFCYETREKAELACKFSKDNQRPYYCDFCCAYHTTHVPAQVYAKSLASKRDEALSDRIKNLAAQESPKDEPSKTTRSLNHELIEAEKHKLDHEESTIGRYVICCRIRQMQNGATKHSANVEQLASTINLDDPISRQAYERAIVDGTLAEKHILGLYMLHKLDISGGLRCDSISDMLNLSFTNLTRMQHKHIYYFLITLYNAKLINVEIEPSGQRIYTLKRELTEDDLPDLPIECRQLFVVNT